MNSLFNSIAQPKMLRLHLRDKIDAALTKDVLATLELNIWRGTTYLVIAPFFWDDALEDLLIDKTQ